MQILESLKTETYSESTYELLNLTVHRAGVFNVQVPTSLQNICETDGFFEDYYHLNQKPLTKDLVQSLIEFFDERYRDCISPIVISPITDPLPKAIQDRLFALHAFMQINPTNYYPGLVSEIFELQTLNIYTQLITATQSLISVDKIEFGSDLDLLASKLLYTHSQNSNGYFIRLQQSNWHTEPVKKDLVSYAHTQTGEFNQLLLDVARPVAQNFLKRFLNFLKNNSTQDDFENYINFIAKKPTRSPRFLSILQYVEEIKVIRAILRLYNWQLSDLCN